MLKRFPIEMSGGERQRVGFAQALAVRPKLILADEPVSMLDVSIRAGVLNMMANLRDQEGVSILYITHDIASARYVADRIIVLYAGHLVEAGPTESVLADPKHPYTQLLLSAVANPRDKDELVSADTGEPPQGDQPERGMSLPLSLSTRDREVLCRSRPAQGRSDRLRSPATSRPARRRTSPTRQGRPRPARADGTPRIHDPGSQGRVIDTVTGPIELVIFDCDGVLIDSERLAVEVDVRVLRELGWAISEAEVVERFVGRSDRDTQAAIEAHLCRELPAGWEASLEALYRKAFAGRLAPVEGIFEALDRITLSSCVASGGTHDHLRYTLGLTGLYERFAGRIFSSEDVARASRPPTSSCTRPSAWRPCRPAASWSRTVVPASKPRAPRACASWRSPAGSRPGESSKGLTRSCSMTCATFQGSSIGATPPRRVASAWRERRRAF